MNIARTTRRSSARTRSHRRSSVRLSAMHTCRSRRLSAISRQAPSRAAMARVRRTTCKMPYVTLNCLTTHTVKLKKCRRSPRFRRQLTHSTKSPIVPCAMPRSFNSSSMFLEFQGDPHLCPCGAHRRARDKAHACPHVARRSVSSHRPWGTLTSPFYDPRTSVRPT